MIGLLPTYEMIGLWAPALLILMRIIQGWASAVNGAARCCWPMNTRQKT